VRLVVDVELRVFPDVLTLALVDVSLFYQFLKRLVGGMPPVNRVVQQFPFVYFSVVGKGIQIRQQPPRLPRKAGILKGRVPYHRKTSRPFSPQYHSASPLLFFSRFAGES
jgi:hypothetical protein